MTEQLPSNLLPEVEITSHAIQELIKLREEREKLVNERQELQKRLKAVKEAELALSQRAKTLDCFGNFCPACGEEKAIKNDIFCSTICLNKGPTPVGIVIAVNKATNKTIVQECRYCHGTIMYVTYESYKGLDGWYHIDKFGRLAKSCSSITAKNWQEFNRSGTATPIGIHIKCEKHGYYNCQYPTCRNVLTANRSWTNINN